MMSYTLPNYACVGNTVWMHDPDSKKTLGEKARWALRKSATCYNEQNLEAVSYKTATVWPVNAHLTNYPTSLPYPHSG